MAAAIKNAETQKNAEKHFKFNDVVLVQATSATSFPLEVLVNEGK